MTYRELFVTTVDFWNVPQDENADFRISDLIITRPTYSRDFEYLLEFVNRIGYRSLRNVQTFDFLNFHFDSAKDKTKFLMVIEYEVLEIMEDSSNKKEVKIKQIEDWLSEKKIELEKPKTTRKEKNKKILPPIYWIRAGNKTLSTDENKLQNTIYKPPPDKEKIKHTYKQWALFFYYCQRQGYYKKFDDFPNSKLQILQEFCQEKNLESVKRFQLDYNNIIKAKERLHTSQKEEIEYVIKLLKDFPKAYDLANDELNTIKSKS